MSGQSRGLEQDSKSEYPGVVENFSARRPRTISSQQFDFRSRVRQLTVNSCAQTRRFRQSCRTPCAYNTFHQTVNKALRRLPEMRRRGNCQLAMVICQPRPESRTTPRGSTTFCYADDFCAEASPRGGLCAETPSRGNPALRHPRAKARRAVAARMPPGRL